MSDLSINCMTVELQKKPSYQAVFCIGVQFIVLKKVFLRLEQHNLCQIPNNQFNSFFFWRVKNLSISAVVLIKVVKRKSHAVSVSPQSSLQFYFLNDKKKTYFITNLLQLIFKFPSQTENSSKV